MSNRTILCHFKLTEDNKNGEEGFAFGAGKIICKSLLKTFSGKRFYEDILTQLVHGQWAYMQNVSG